MDTLAYAGRLIRLPFETIGEEIGMFDHKKRRSANREMFRWIKGL